MLGLVVLHDAASPDQALGGSGMEQAQVVVEVLPGALDPPAHPQTPRKEPSQGLHQVQMKQQVDPGRSCNLAAVTELISHDGAVRIAR